VQIEYVREESPSAAQKLRVELLKITSGLKNIPERFSRETLSPKQWQRIPFLD
jgi:hypothetical protein